MSLTTTDQVFVRCAGTLWRDTGIHVLALTEEDGSEVVVLGGGSAVLWRLLEQPATLAELVSRLVVDGGTAPDQDDVRGCLEDLVARGLVEGSAVERAG